ncbi:MAG: hypothetical protein JWQ25_3048, partial [Daejeonella sp.]|nr:hypothetical protein [Daejeonella sp.]
EEGDTLVSAVQKLQSEFLNFGKLKISGFVQAQYQIADTAGATTFAGSNFGTHISNRFGLRETRLKFVYTANPLAKFQVQFDLRETGLTIRDAFTQLTAPFFKPLSVTAGMFDRPFGFAISYSSSVREAPDRARIIQTLFPGERDLGAKVTIQGPKTSSWDFLTIDLGYFNGNGINAETDSKKDFIGRISVNKANKAETFKYGFGVSYYNGGIIQTTDNILSVDESANTPAFVAKPIPVDGTYKNKYALREYTGADVELTVASAIGFTTLQAEYIKGNQPGFSSATNAGNVSPTAPVVVGDTYLRKFSGSYINLVQDFSNAPISLVARYDVYDPNTRVEGNGVSVTTKFSGADIKYTTYGFGIIYKYDSNVRLTGYYDLAKNETSSNLPRYSKDLKDNVITLRLQYKF